MKKIFTAVVFITAFFINSFAQTVLNISFTDAAIAERHFLKCYYINYGKEELLDSVLVYDAYKSNLTFRLPPNYSGACFLSLDKPAKSNPLVVITPSEKIINIETTVTDFQQGKILILNSNENKVYTMAMDLKQEFDNKSMALQKVRNGMLKYDSMLYTKVKAYESEYESIRRNLNDQLDVLTKVYTTSYTAQHLVPCLKQPVRSDNAANTRNYDNIESFMHYHYFDHINFADTLLLNHVAFPSVVSIYLNTFTDGSEKNLNSSTDIIMEKASANAKMKDFTFNLLLNHYLDRNYDYAVTYLNDKYADGCSVGVTPDKQKFVEALKNTQVGAKIPDLVLYDNNGQIKSLYNSFTQSKYTIFYVWTSWCHSCQNKTPVLMEILKKYKKTDVNLFAISLDEKKDDWAAGIAKYKLADYTNVAELVPMAKSTVLPSYAIRTTPKLYVLDNTGKIIAKDVYGDDLKKLLESLAK